MKDILHTATWRRWVLAAILYVLFSVLPALLVLKYVVQLNNAILVSVIFCQIVLFVFLRRTFLSSAERMLGAICEFVKSDPKQIKDGDETESREVKIDKEDA